MTIFDPRASARVLAIAALAVFTMLAGGPLRAQSDPRAAAEAEMRAALAAAQAVAQPGPADIKLAGQAVLKLADTYLFIPGPEGTRMLRAMGNKSADVIGLVFPKDDGRSWFAALRYVSSGYIKDDDARDWKADEMLESIRANVEESNAERRRIGMPEIELGGWVERPTYDAAAHRLVWSVSSQPKRSSDPADRSINYNTYALGREGYLSLNWVTDLDKIEGQKSEARALLAALEFDAGKRYADFDSATDHVAEYGLAALVAGVAAKKLGLFAVMAAFLLKFWKIGLVAVLALGGPLAKRLRNRKNKTDPPPAA